MSKKLKAAIERTVKLMPQWMTKNRTVMVLADQELIATWNAGEGVNLKKKRCDFCAECCLHIPDDYLPFGTNGEGRCNMLGDDMKCKAGHARPFACLADPPPGDIEDYNCCIEYLE
jgi:hypothetical protein